MKQLAATPIGMRVWARAEVISVKKRLVTFRVEARDKIEKIGEGTNVRAIVEEARFRQGIMKKVNRLGCRARSVFPPEPSIASDISGGDP